MMRAAFTALSCLWLAALAVPALAQDPAMAEGLAIPADFAELRAKDARIQRLGHELATANAPFCEETRPSPGLMLHDIAAYGDSALLREALGLNGDIAVQVAVPGGPADGLLARDTAIRAVAGQEVADAVFDEERKWLRMTSLNTRMETALEQTGQVTLTTAEGRDVTIIGTPACATRFEIGAIGKRAAADGKRVVIGEEFPGLAYDDPELAAVIAHELAHNILRHRALLDERGRKRRLVRATEREADRLAPWLIANAGYDPAAATRFMQAWGPDHSGGWLLRKRTHDGWDERAETIAAEVALVRSHMAASGRADWKTHFAREGETR
ncbi:M48 family metalloprotease [Erythrobacteraceae bacterium WH01K]|nr:M48 family metalloprotease [Erythrobacteraceae bacterium WH01K]